ncbi:hypothetical protein GCM10007938_03760 [Vibrio zhanjiangensis]|uniref:DUF3160 domain-containing protein n=1 Tax=Vibrio zhanjiangensis TaxID=1046128 RepID=A0ABQ6ETY3_9VIBR|nr:hypothetical protein [Vibrio zhanjiangensis]GLT16600.1 hypothetical protein GCM10007938_03760 [Vibrio zhanjiangensis]
MSYFVKFKKDYLYKKYKWLLTIFFTSFILVGCGGGDDKPNSGVPATPASPATPVNPETPATPVNPAVEDSEVVYWDFDLTYPKDTNRVATNEYFDSWGSLDDELKYKVIEQYGKILDLVDETTDIYNITRNDQEVIIKDVYSRFYSMKRVDGTDIDLSIYDDYFDAYNNRNVHLEDMMNYALVSMNFFKDQYYAYNRYHHVKQDIQNFNQITHDYSEALLQQMRSAPDFVEQYTANLPGNADQNVNFDGLFQNDVFAVLNQANFPSVSAEDYRTGIQEAYEDFKIKWVTQENEQRRSAGNPRLILDPDMLDRPLSAQERIDFLRPDQITQLYLWGDDLHRDWETIKNNLPQDIKDSVYFMMVDIPKKMQESTELTNEEIDELKNIWAHHVLNTMDGCHDGKRSKLRKLIPSIPIEALADLDGFYHSELPVLGKVSAIMEKYKRQKIKSLFGLNRFSAEQTLYTDLGNMLRLGPAVGILEKFPRLEYGTANWFGRYLENARTEQQVIDLFNGVSRNEMINAVMADLKDSEDDLEHLISLKDIEDVSKGVPEMIYEKRVREYNVYLMGEDPANYALSYILEPDTGPNNEASGRVTEKTVELMLFSLGYLN